MARRFMVLILGLSGFIPFHSVCADDAPRVVSVRGECQTKVSPDRGSLILSIRSRKPSAGAAAQQTQERFNSLIGKVRKLALKEMTLQTQTFQVNEEFDYVNGKQNSRGFVALQSLEVETSEPQKLSEVLKLAADEKVDDIGALQTFPSLTSLKKARESCLEEAFQNAKQKAERLVKSSGQKLGPAVSIHEVFGGFSAPPSPMRAKMMMAAESAPGGEVATKDRELQVFTDVQFELK